jgi:hypothetical protein
MDLSYVSELLISGELGGGYEGLKIVVLGNVVCTLALLWIVVRLANDVARLEKMIAPTFNLLR